MPHQLTSRETPLNETRPFGLSVGRFSGTISIHWFILLRWVAVMGQLTSVLTAQYLFGLDLQIQPLLIAIAVTAGSNLVLMAWSFRYHSQAQNYARIWSRILAVVMAIDLLILTCMLYFSGGPSNPFWIFFWSIFVWPEWN